MFIVRFYFIVNFIFIKPDMHRAFSSEWILTDCCKNDIINFSTSRLSSCIRNKISTPTHYAFVDKFFLCSSISLEWFRKQEFICTNIELKIQLSSRVSLKHFVCVCVKKFDFLLNESLSHIYPWQYLLICSFRSLLLLIIPDFFCLYFAALKVKLMVRRPINQLVEQGIMPRK